MGALQSLLIIVLQIVASLSVKKCENRSINCKDMNTSLVACFFDSLCSSCTVIETANKEDNIHQLRELVYVLELQIGLKAVTVRL